MVITLSRELETALTEAARKQGLAPEDVAINVLYERFLGVTPSFLAEDEWERGLLAAARDCGVSSTDAALSTEGLYD